jgi:RimJ/RimL family protein N-acetyltransferase
LSFLLKVEQTDDNRPFVRQWTRTQHWTAIDSPDSAHLIIESVAENKPVGYAIINGLESPDQNLEFMRIVIEDKSRGYGRAAIRLIKQWAFEEKKAHRLWLDVKIHNQRARRIYEAAGFVLEGVLRECIKADDGYQSLAIMSILENEYNANN